MKKSGYYFAVLLAIALQSCSQNKSSNETAAVTGNTDSLCYASFLGSDSAKLVINDDKGIINGRLDMFFKEKSNLTGTIKGSFKGDTLFLDYTYRIGKKPEYFQNPFVFLKKDGKFYQGHGEITSTYGRTHFKEGNPIDFTKGFVLSAVDCR